MPRLLFQTSNPARADCYSNSRRPPQRERERFTGPAGESPLEPPLLQSLFLLLVPSVNRVHRNSRLVYPTHYQRAKQDNVDLTTQTTCRTPSLTTYLTGDSIHYEAAGCSSAPIEPRGHGKASKKLRARSSCLRTILQYVNSMGSESPHVRLTDVVVLSLPGQQTCPGRRQPKVRSNVCLCQRLLCGAGGAGRVSSTDR